LWQVAAHASLAEDCAREVVNRRPVVIADRQLADLTLDRKVHAVEVICQGLADRGIGIACYAQVRDVGNVESQLMGYRSLVKTVMQLDEPAVAFVGNQKHVPGVGEVVGNNQRAAEHEINRSSI